MTSCCVLVTFRLKKHNVFKFRNKNGGLVEISLVNYVIFTLPKLKTQIRLNSIRHLLKHLLNRLSYIFRINNLCLNCWETL